MNRKERRRLAALAAKTPLPPARQDGRPLYYDINDGERVLCFYCIKAGLTGMRYERRKAVMSDPANPPEGDRAIHTICIHHLPENAVIYDPTTNLCRNKSGTETWMEDDPDPNASFEG